eukprot:50333-Rhodomonas_salina.3
MFSKCRTHNRRRHAGTDCSLSCPNCQSVSGNSKLINLFHGCPKPSFFLNVGDFRSSVHFPGFQPTPRNCSGSDESTTMASEENSLPKEHNAVEPVHASSSVSLIPNCNTARAIPAMIRRPLFSFLYVIMTVTTRSLIVTAQCLSRYVSGVPVRGPKVELEKRASAATKSLRLTLIPTRATHWKHAAAGAISMGQGESGAAPARGGGECAVRVQCKPRSAAAAPADDIEGRESRGGRIQPQREN